MPPPPAPAPRWIIALFHRRLERIHGDMGHLAQGPRIGGSFNQTETHSGDAERSHTSRMLARVRKKAPDKPQLSLSQNTSTASRFMMPHIGVPSRTRPVRMRWLDSS